RGRVIGQPVILATAIGELRLHEHVGARHDAVPICGGQRLAHPGFDVVPTLVGRVDAAEAAAQRELRQRRGAILLPRRADEEFRTGGGGHYGAGARGATETPRAPIRSIARATSPEVLASSTKPRRYARPASRPRGTPTACGTFMNWPSSMRAPGSLSTSPISACVSPASASAFPVASRSNASWAVAARTSCARLRLRLRNSS